ncbi:MAG: helix-turn-helix domain-containing protein [Oscillospiraceae bacterium]|nr:helix-turn-helix domain-containing protein [Oscillospiraceae bacterium]
MVGNHAVHIGQAGSQLRIPGRYHAADLLQDKSIPITEVATRSGYNSISSFNRCFINRFGVSPTQWQKNAN